MALNTTIDLANSPEENILDLLQSAAKVGVTLTPADFSYAVAPLGVADVEGRNTTLTVTALEAGQFLEDATTSFTYKRPAPAATLAFESTNLEATAAQIRAAIATQLKIHESEFTGWTTVVDHPGVNQQVTVELEANAASLLYTGSVEVTLDYIVLEPGPADAFDTTELDGLELSL
jgi:hypothetical protein